MVVCDNGYHWLTIMPWDEYYCITVMMDDADQMKACYIDIIDEQGYDDDSVPYFYDLYLDLVVYPDGDIIVDDMDELQEALETGEITKRQYSGHSQLRKRCRMDYYPISRNFRTMSEKCLVSSPARSSYSILRSNKDKRMDNFSRFDPYPGAAFGMARPGVQAYPMPFYQMFEYPRALREEQENERDAQRMMAMYPEVGRAVQRRVEDECDKMEYEGSIMYDEQPDRLMVSQISRSIYDQMKDQYPVMEENNTDDELTMQEGRRRYPPNQNWLSDLIQIMLANEMHRRRCRRRHCRRFY